MQAISASYEAQRLQQELAAITEERDALRRRAADAAAAPPPPPPALTPAAAPPGPPSFGSSLPGAQGQGVAGQPDSKVSDSGAGGDREASAGLQARLQEQSRVIRSLMDQLEESSRTFSEVVSTK